MTKLENVIKGLECWSKMAIKCDSECPYKPNDEREKFAGECDFQKLCTDALELLKEQEAIKPNRGPLDNYYCGICGNMITASIKIFDGERYMIEHPDHLKPEHKWKYCKNCGTAVRWDE